MKKEMHIDEEVIKRNKLLEYPEHLRGPSNNRYGGHQATRLRGYGRVGRAGPVKIYTESEKRKLEAELRAAGRI